MMRRLQRLSSLSLRIALAAVVSVLILVPAVGYLTTEAAVTQTLRSMLDRMRPETFAKEMEDCARAPQGWSASASGRFETFAYDGVTLQSQNPNAPPLDAILVKRLAAGEDRPSRVTLLDDNWGGAMLDRRAPTGPCAVMQMRWRGADKGRRNVQRRSLLVLVGVLAVTLFSIMMFAVRPIVRRLRLVAKAAQRVGETDRYESAADKTEDAIGGLSVALDGAHARIIADRHTLKDHLANIAHDIRTPLASLQLTLEQATGEAQSDAQRTQLYTALDDLAYIDGLTNNLHLASKVEGDVGPLDGGHTVDLGRTVDFVLSRFRVAGRRKGIEVVGSRPDTQVEVECDPWMVQQVISNLVDNAVKYGHEGGHVAVVLERDGTAFDLTVVDDGPGVTPEELRKMTTRTFRSTEAIQRDSAGAGLGLAIALKVCELAGFSIALEHAAPHGLEVHIRGPTVDDG